MLRDSDLPGQMDAAVRGLTAALQPAASEPYRSSSGGGARGPDADDTRNGGERGGASSHGLDALRRGVAVTLGQLLQTAACDASAPEGSDEINATARQSAVVAAVLAVGGTCGASPAASPAAEDEEEQPPAAEEPANGDAAHVANGVSHHGGSGRLQCLQASLQMRICIGSLPQNSSTRQRL